MLVFLLTTGWANLGTFEMMIGISVERGVVLLEAGSAAWTIAGGPWDGWEEFTLFGVANARLKQLLLFCACFRFALDPMS